MSAQLADSGAVIGASRNRFTAHLDLPAGVTVSIHAPTLTDLSVVVAKLQATEPANDAVKAATLGKPAGKTPTPAAATAQAGAPASQTTEASATPAAVQAAQAEAGNAVAASPSPAAAAASTASSSEPAASPEVSFDVLKKAFLALSTKENGRAKCEGVLKPFAIAKLSEAKPEQYTAVLAEIQKVAG